MDGQTIGALATATLEQSQIVQVVEQPVKQARAGIVRHEPIAKLTQDTEVEAGGIERQVQSILPIQAHAQCVGGCTVAQLFAAIPDTPSFTDVVRSCR